MSAPARSRVYPADEGRGGGERSGGRQAAASTPRSPSTVGAAVAAVAVLCAASALSGVLQGTRWTGFAIVTVVVVAVSGIALRSLRLPMPVIVLGQLAALAALLTAVFTRSGVLGVLPGPSAVSELADVLARAGVQVRDGVAPVPTTPELLCLITVSVGLVAVAVDVLAVTAAAPAASGLVLLCVLAVPASVAPQLLPWWAFASGAAGFALLLTVDSQRRHLVWGEPAGPAGQVGAAPAAALVATAAVVLGLVAGTVTTSVGTEGKLPGSGLGADAESGVGLNPFTALRGQLDGGEVVELFRVQGLPGPAYLRALTLSRYEPGQGWRPGDFGAAAPADADLPLPAALDGPPPGQAVTVRIEPVGYQDNWLPGYGLPRSYGGVSGDWRFHPDALTTFSEQPRTAPPYTLDALLPVPSPEQLRATGTDAVDPRYRSAGPLDPRVVDLAERVTAGAPTPFDRAIALNRYFTDPASGFRYDERTAPGNSGDALVDFLVQGRTGYCEQFASSMAIMLRAVGVPARVAIGFTAGTPNGEFRRITTEDAHAWVEAWFDGVGWIPFDPTPLADGRLIVPPYVAAATGPSAVAPAAPAPPPSPAAPAPPPATPPPSAAPVDPADAGSRPGPWLAVALLGVVLVLAAPAVTREVQRRTRLRRVLAGGPGAADAAWRELTAESSDRGGVARAGETVRSAGRRLAREHDLDEGGRDGLRGVVQAVERSWYASPPTRDDRSGGQLASALAAARAGLRRSAPLPLRARLLPRSVVHRRPPRSDDAD